MIVPLLLIGLLGDPAPRDRPFNHVTLPEKNSVTVSTDLPDFYDTIIKVGLGGADLAGLDLLVIPIGEQNREDGVLAHVKKFGGRYYLFISVLDRRDAIEVIGHEVWHVIQYDSGELAYDYSTGAVRWEGADYYNEAIPYEERPWERDAFVNGPVISSRIERELW